MTIFLGKTVIFMFYKIKYVEKFTQLKYFYYFCKRIKA